MARRSTLADKPELDALLEKVMIQYKGEKFLPIVPKTVEHLTQFLKGSKPVTRASLNNLLINAETNSVCAGLFVAALEQIGPYCKHLAIVAPFHTTEFTDTTDGESKNPELGSDWDKILGCLPNLRRLTFEDQSEETTALLRDTYYLLNYALANNTTFQKYVDICFDVKPQLNFDFRHDFRRRQRRSSSSPFTSSTSTPLTMIGSDMIYADGAEEFGPLDDDSVFGKVDGIDEADE